MQFLRQKVELATDRTAVRQEFLRLRDMRNKTVELLADIGFGSKQDGLLVEPIRIEALRCLEQRRHLFGKTRLYCFRLPPRGALRSCGESCNFVEPLRQQPSQSFTFCLPHLEQCRQCLSETGDNRGLGGPMLLLALVLFGDFNYTFERQDAVEGRRSCLHLS